MPYVSFPSRLLSPNHRVGFPRSLIILDTESKIKAGASGDEHTFRLGWTNHITFNKELVIMSSEYRPWADPLEVCRYINGLCSSHRTLHLLGHNLFFDLQLSRFFYFFPRWGWRLRFIYDEGLTYILIIARNRSSIKCLSTTNYFDASLDELAHDLGMAKIDVDFKTASEDELSDHCKMDVEITTAAFLKYLRFNRLHDTGAFRLTRASQSMACFRHRFMRHRIAIHSDEKARGLERAAYFGGRVEAFQLGAIKGGPFVFLDVNSMYPSVMHGHDYPCRLAYYSEESSLKMLARHIDSSAAVARVKVKTDEPVYPLRIGGKVCFPIGSFVTTMTTASLRYAIEHDHIKAVETLALYDKAPLFDAYVDYWYPLKARYKSEGNKIYTRMVKLYLNSLYGKFGQQAYLEDREDIPGCYDTLRMDNYDAITGEHWIEYMLFCTAIRQYGKEDTRNTFTAIAAHVTDYARIKLWDLIKRAGSGGVIYCDTDSVVIRERDLVMYRGLLSASALGGLSIAKRAYKLVVHGAKDYETDEGPTIKGVPRGAEQSSPGVYRYEHFDRSLTLQRAGNTDSVMVKPVERRLKRVYDKGVVDSDGRVRPFILTDHSLGGV